MKEVPVKLGPLALLLSVISICLTTLAILTFTTARADLRLAEKYADTVSLRYALEQEGQDFLRILSETDQADYGLMGLERDADGVYWETFEKDDAKLRIGFVPGEKTITLRKKTGNHPGLIVLDAFTKRFAMPGDRKSVV